MSDPFREHRLAPAEVRRILRRATEIADADPETHASERALTRAELEEAAGGLGLPSTSIARAFDGGEPGPLPSTGRSWFLGGPTRLVLAEEVAGEPTDTDLEDLLDEIREQMCETGSVETVGKTLVWKPAPMQGRLRDLSVRVRARGGRTRIVVEERLSRQATALFVGLGVGGGVGPLGGYIAAIAILGVVGVVFPLLWIPTMLLLARTIFTAMGERRQRSLDQLMSRIRRCAAGWSRERAPVPVRVAASEPASGARGDAEIEAEAEVEAAAARSGATK